MATSRLTNPGTGKLDLFNLRLKPASQIREFEVLKAILDYINVSEAAGSRGSFSVL